MNVVFLIWDLLGLNSHEASIMKMVTLFRKGLIGFWQTIVGFWNFQVKSSPSTLFYLRSLTTLNQSLEFGLVAKKEEFQIQRNVVGW